MTVADRAAEVLNGVIGFDEYPPRTPHAEHQYASNCAVCTTKRPESLVAIADALAAAGLLVSDVDRAVLDAADRLAERWITAAIILPPDIGEFVVAVRARRETQP